MTAALNPLLEAWTTPYGAPPFDRIKAEDYRPAFDATMAEQKMAVEQIAADPAAPTFDNTVAALERSGMPLSRVASVFFGLAAFWVRRTHFPNEHVVAEAFVPH